MMYSIVVAALFVLWLPLHSLAATYYVANGGVNNSCVSAQNPSTRRNSIAAGLQCLTSGDTLVVGSGTYNETIADTIPSGSLGSPTIVRSEVQYGAVIQPDSSQLRASKGLVVVGRSVGGTNTDRNDITIDGFVIDGGSLSGRPIAAMMVWGANASPGTVRITIKNNELRNVYNWDDADNSTGISGGPCCFSQITIDSNKIHDIGLNSSGHYWKTYGIYLGFASSIIENNEFYNISGFGIHGYNGGADTVNDNIIRSNYVHNCGGTGIAIYEGSSNQVYNNVVVGNGFNPGGNTDNKGIIIGGFGGDASNTLVYNNTIYGNAGYGLALGVSGPAINTVIRNNIFWQNSNDDISTGNSSGNVISNNLINQNPQFIDIDNENFRLQDTSPSSAKTGGFDVTSVVTVDKTGAARTVPLSMGAYEFGVSAAATKLVFSTQPQGVGAGLQMAAVVVSAVDDTGATDAAFVGDVTLVLLRVHDTAGTSVAVDSEETELYNGVDFLAAYGNDGNYSTMWHTDFVLTQPGHPHTYTLNLGGSKSVNGVRYVPRLDGNNNGSLGQYEVYLSSNCSSFGSAVASGTLTGGKPETIGFSSAMANCVRLNFITDLNSTAYSSAADVFVQLTSGGTLSGTATVGAVNGVTTFTGLSINPTGRYVLLASASGLVNMDSAPFLITTPPEPAPVVISKGMIR